MTGKPPKTDLIDWGGNCPGLWVILGAHLNLDEAISRHGKEYLEETGKDITGLIWQYARREFTDEGDGQQAYFLYKKKVKGATTEVTIIADKGIPCKELSEVHEGVWTFLDCHRRFPSKTEPDLFWCGLSGKYCDEMKEGCQEGYPL